MNFGKKEFYYGMILTADERNSSLVDLSLCGANDCPVKPKDTNIGSPSEKVITLMSIYLAVGIMAAIIIALLLDKIKVLGSETKDRGFFSLFFATMRHLKDTRMRLLIPLTIYSGLEQGFVYGDFTKVTQSTSEFEENDINRHFLAYKHNTRL